MNADRGHHQAELASRQRCSRILRRARMRQYFSGKVAGSRGVFFVYQIRGFDEDLRARRIARAVHNERRSRERSPGPSTTSPDSYLLHVAHQSRNSDELFRSFVSADSLERRMGQVNCGVCDVKRRVACRCRRGVPCPHGDTPAFTGIGDRYAARSSTERHRHGMSVGGLIGKATGGVAPVIGVSGGDKG